MQTTVTTTAPAYAPLVRFDIVDSHTGRIVGCAKNRRIASRMVDVRDNAYGAYRYRARAVYAEV